MAPPLLFDISHVDLDRPVFNADEIERVNPHRGHMRLIDTIAWVSDDLTHLVACKQVRDDEFWVPGHIPGRPLLPGVLMIEAAAQIASYSCLRQGLHDLDFMGFAGVDGVKFRGQVVPGDQFIILCQQTENRPRRCVCRTQGLVNGTLVFEATITGMPMQVKQQA